MKSRNRRDGEGGFVIVIALIALMAMSFFLMTGVATTTSTLKISGNYAKTVDAFNIAEVGIAKARPILEASSFNDLLSGCGGQPNEIIAETAFGTGKYQVYITDNDDGDGNLCNDTDNIARVISYGTNASGGKVQIEAYMQKPTADGEVELPSEPAEGAGAAMLCGTESDIQVQGSSTIDGKDRAVPDLSSCTTGQCPLGTVVGPGGYAAIGASTLNATSSGAAKFVSNNTPTTKGNVGDTYCEEWRTLRDQLAALDPDHESVVILDAGNYSSFSNDCSDPKVYILNTNGTVRFSGNARYCGIFVVAADVQIDLTGNAVVVGVILIMGDSSKMSYTSGSGNPEFYGQVIVESTSVDKAKELTVTGAADIYYSSEGIGYAKDAVNSALSDPSGGGGGGLITMSWKETY